jgi:hypothetical protein
MGGLVMGGGIVGLVTGVRIVGLVMGVRAKHSVGRLLV